MVDNPKASMYVWAKIPEQYRAMGSLEFAKKVLADAKVSVSPGVGFGEYGDQHVRFAMIENESAYAPGHPRDQADVPRRRTALMTGNAMKPLQVGLLGMGTVGNGTWTVLRRNEEEITRRAGRPIRITWIAERALDVAREKTRGATGVNLTNDARGGARRIRTSTSSSS